MQPVRLENPGLGASGGQPGGGGDGVGALLGGLMSLWPLMMRQGGGVDQERVRRYRMMSLDQLAEEPESVEKQLALEEKDTLGRPGELGVPPEGRKYEVEQLYYPQLSPLGEGNQLPGASIVVKNPLIEKSSHLRRGPGVEAWVRMLQNEYPIAFEIQSNPEAYSRDASERAAIEAFLQEAVKNQSPSVGLTTIQSALKAQGHSDETPHMSRKYKEEFPKIFQEYTGAEPQLREYTQPLEEKKIEENLMIMSLLKQKQDIIDLMSGAEYTPIDPYYLRHEGRPAFMPEDTEWERLPDQVKEKIMDQRRYWDTPEPKILTNVSSDGSYGISPPEGYKYSLSKNIESINRGYPNVLPEKKVQAKEKLKSFWEYMTKNPYHSDEKYLPLGVGRYRTIKPLHEQPMMEYQEFDLEKLLKQLDEGRSPWLYMTPASKKPENE